MLEFAELLNHLFVPCVELCTRVPICMPVSTQTDRQTTHVKLNNVHVKLSNIDWQPLTDTNRPQTISRSVFNIERSAMTVLWRRTEVCGIDAIFYLRRCDMKTHNSWQKASLVDHKNLNRKITEKMESWCLMSIRYRISVQNLWRHLSITSIVNYLKKSTD